ncbi:AI-2E family transporter [Bythopirellula polymerisocia]|uniref:Pheromone autoinducer 2 transporter n=1 Tax=Bythopirellula polymerisocia TaxID=2528003 RepID=A0A5C6D1F8_9BACT|nr:AI-2E family transporter [Bythopirellula polymerisocia]TWU29664.1 pheromone autoinducer 2 transporter [Bythopirellula polymerisocia]
MSDGSIATWLSRNHWQKWLIWALFIFLAYELRDFFFVAFVTFLLCYLVRTVVGTLSERLSPGQPKVWLDRTLTMATFVVMVCLLFGVASWIGPRFVQQCRALIARQQQIDPQAAFQSLLDRTVGSVLMRREYGGNTSERYKTALENYQNEGRHGEGWYAQFPALDSHLKSGFEAQFEQAERERIDRQVRGGTKVGNQFDQWFLRVKAPELFAQRRETYLAQWAAEQTKQPNREDETKPIPEDHFQQTRDEAIRQRILGDVKADPVTFADLKNQWEQSLVALQWLTFVQSPKYQQAFRDYYQQRHEENPVGIPFSYDIYLELREAYPNGKNAFAKVVQRSLPSKSKESAAQLRQDFEMATREQLTSQWWKNDPTAAALREHASEDLPRVVGAVSARLEQLLSRLLTLPTQLATAMLLTLFICFDMLHLREGLGRLRESRIGNFYDEIVPGLIVFARLIGRSFSAQALIAVFNTLLSLLLLWFLGIENELLLCMFVFVGSFIPVLGVLLSSIPITIQALLQPDGSIGLAIQAIAGILLIHMIETSFLSPKIVGKVLHLHPVMVLVILAIGEHFFGLWGLLLGVPVAVYLIRVVILKEPIPGIYEPARDSSAHQVG